MNAAISAYVSAFLYTISARFENKDKGASAVEYGLLIGLIAIAIITTVGLLGKQINEMFLQAKTAIGG